MNCFTFKTALCTLTLCSENGVLVKILFENEACGQSNTGADAVIERAIAQIEEYLNGKRTAFDLPIAPTGTPFQLKVWNALMRIPYGKTASYADIARAAGYPRAYRAVGMANNQNKLPIVVPCHRVIGASGGLTGYRGGLDVKRRLLDLEASHAGV